MQQRLLLAAGCLVCTVVSCSAPQNSSLAPFCILLQRYEYAYGFLSMVVVPRVWLQRKTEPVK